MYRSLLVAIPFSLAVLIAPTPSAQEAPGLNTIEVSVTDTLRVTPDRAIVRFALTTRGQGPEEARLENEQAAQRVLNAVRERGIPERHIQVRLLQVVEGRPERGSRREFIARRDIEVIVDEMVRLPAIVARVIQEGATEFRGITYDLRNRRIRENEIIQRTAERAREKADLIAGTLGTSVVGVHRVTESHVHAPPMSPAAGRARMHMEEIVVATHEAFAPGEIEVRAALSVVFILE